MLYPNELKMPGPLQQLYDGFIAAIAKVKETEPPSINRSARLVEAAVKAMEQIRDYVTGHRFTDKEAEIHFFKYVKPMFYAQFLFYRTLYFMDIHKPEGSEKTIRKFYKKKLRGISDYFDEHRGMYEYIRRGLAFRDDLYFLRKPPISAGIEAGLPDRDPQFATAKDFEVAEILQNELLQQYLLDILSPGKESGAASLDSGIHWTATLNAFYQLMRALIRKGAINNGNITMSKFAEACEWFFHINLKNMYRGMQENRIKKDRSAFLKELWKAHEDDLDDLDENPRYK